MNRAKLNGMICALLHNKVLFLTYHGNAQSSFEIPRPAANEQYQHRILNHCTAPVARSAQLEHSGPSAMPSGLSGTGTPLKQGRKFSFSKCELINRKDASRYPEPY